MSDKSYLDWPFFEARHRELQGELEAWCAANIRDDGHADADAVCKDLVRRLGAAGWLRYAVGGTANGGKYDVIDTRAICLLRETLARHSGLADFAFAMQGLGSGAITLHGTPQQRQHYLTQVAGGGMIAAFALSEPESGSDVAAMRCAARAEGDEFVLDGEKTWISNGGIADFYVVFARTGEAPGARGLSAFVVDAGTPGFEVAERIAVIAPHPLACLRFSECRVPKSALLGKPGQGFKVAMQTLDIFLHLGGGGGAWLRAPCAGFGFGARHHAGHVQPDPGGLPDHPRQAGADGYGHRYRRAPDLPRRLAA